LDELNLAPSDVLEALNRLLDDNREIFIPETQETIRPHKNFMLFATQNPVGQYGGRKQLSRAFRNRFLELHFSDIPGDELEVILSKRCKIAPSYAKKLVNVYKILQKSRGNSRIFDGSFGFITLRDLFRWALRDASDYQQLGENGYMILAERMRTTDDRLTVQQVLEKELRISIQPPEMYHKMWTYLSEKLNSQFNDPVFKEIVWTQAMKKLFILSYNCLQYSEPILLVGETGCGKTTICQLLASLAHLKLHIVNAHQHSETSDFIGSQRPCRNRHQLSHEITQELITMAKDLQVSNIETLGPLELYQLIQRTMQTLNDSMDNSMLLKWQNVQNLFNRSKVLFEWTDGPLVEAMKCGDYFLLDEISLADDSVLERLNSVLEPSRLIVLAEKGDGKIHEIYADKKFRFFATMNPGGDYGKKELSPALRNRFTEIWVSSISDESDISLIIQKKINCISGLEDQSWHSKILAFYSWISTQINKRVHEIISLRDILSWIEFIFVTSPKVGPSFAFLNGAMMTIIDGLRMNPLIGATSDVERLQKSSTAYLSTLSGVDSFRTQSDVISDHEKFGIHPFYIGKGTLISSEAQFSFSAPTTFENTFRILRAMQLSKSILMEGSPGVGKTSLILSLAAFTGHNVVRINLSEQTDLMDLLGTDLPVEDGASGQFAWNDGPLLQALQNGSWVLLDELNLASQQVLEGLNACLDHRATIYIPELGKSFKKHPNFRLFGAQNPQQQGGGRKGLPKSFMNRFTLVYLNELNYQDLLLVCKDIYGTVIPENLLESMITFNECLRRETAENMSFGWLGSPWEFNLRDVMRWADLICKEADISQKSAFKFFQMLYLHRFRSAEDRKAAKDLFLTVFKKSLLDEAPELQLSVDRGYLRIGMATIETKSHKKMSKKLALLPSMLPFMESIAKSIEMGWMPLLIGPSGSGKTSLIRYFAELCGESLVEFSMNAGVDAIELLGGFEQEDISRTAHNIKEVASILAFKILQTEICMKSGLSLSNDERSIVMRIQKELVDVDTFFEEHYAFVQKLVFDFQLEELKSSCIELDKLYEEYIALKRNTGPGKFKWIDGLLINAMRKGQWIVIDNVNLCSKSVIDRLNSLLEKNGCLMVNERGLVNGKMDIVSPHPKFRIFMTMDPSQGEISRAMRNRSVELYLDSFDPIAKAVDTIKILSSYGIRSLQSDNINDIMEYDRISALENSKVFVEEMERGLTHKNGDSNFYNLLSAAFVPSLEYSGLCFETQNMLLDAHILTKIVFASRLVTHYQSYEFLDHYQASSSSVFREAVLYFSKVSTFAERSMRSKWLSFLNEWILLNSRKNFSLSTVDGAYITAAAVTLSKSSYNLSSIQPHLTRACIMFESISSCALTQSKELKITNLNLISQSALFCSGKLTVSDLKHPSIKSLYKFLNVLFSVVCKLALSGLIDDRVVGCVLNGIEPLFWFSFNSKFTLAGMIACIYGARKTLLKNVSQFAAQQEVTDLTNIMDQMCSLLQLDQIYTHSKVVGKLRNESLKFQELFDIQQELFSYDNYIQETLFNQTGKNLSTNLQIVAAL
jgi:midasin